MCGMEKMGHEGKKGDGLEEREKWGLVEFGMV